MADIFICYARGDRDKVEKLASALQGEGWSVWWDRQIVGGAEFSKDIERELTAAKVAIVAWSKASVDSRWVRDEAVAAAEAGKLVPVSLDGAPAPMGFRQFHTIELGTWQGDVAAPAFQEVARAVRGLLTGTAQAAIPAAKASWAKRLMKPLPLAAIGAAMLALVGVLVWQSMRPASSPRGAAIGASPPAAAAPAQTIEAASIAVLPFSDLSPGKDQEYFSDGIAEEILNVLARVDGLKVASRTSSFQFRSTASGIPLIARELGVRHVLEGSVRKAGDTIRITAQLIDANTDKHLWSESFDRTLTAENIFAIQDEIANAIVAAMRARMIGGIAEAAPASPVRTTNIEAYELFLKARALFQARRDLGQSDRLLEEAIQIDPQFADALAIRAAIHQFGGEYGADFGDAQEARRRGRGFAERALAINGANSLALAVTALSHLYDRIEGFGREDYSAIFTGFDRALALDPNNSNALNWQGLAYGFVGDNARAANIHRRCISIEPAHAACRSNLAMELISLGRKGDASAIIDAAADAGVMSLSPGMLVTLAELKRREAFLFLAVNVPALRGWHKFNALYDAVSDPDGDHRLLAAELKTFLLETEAPARIYALLNALGDYERPLLLTYHWVGLLGPYRQSPEFKKHMRASGLPVYWRAHGFPLQCKPLGKDDFECK